MKIPISQTRLTPRIKQRIVNWLLSDEEVRIPAGVKFGPNSVTVGAPTADDIQFDADGGLAQQDGTVVLFLPNDGSVAIESVVNSSIGDSVDYIDPLWLGRSDYIPTIFPWFSLDGYAEDTSGSGASSLTFGRAEFTTGGTNGSHIQVGAIQARRGGKVSTFDKDHVLRIDLNILTSTTNRTDYYTIGRPFGSSKGFGIKIASGELQGVVHNGTSENTTTLLASGSFSTGRKQIEVRFSAGSQVEWLVDDSSEGTETTAGNLPTGDSFLSGTLQIRIDNSEAAEKNTRFIRPIQDWQAVA